MQKISKRSSGIKLVEEPSFLSIILSSKNPFEIPGAIYISLMPYGVSTQLQSSGLVAHENSTFRNLALAVSGAFMA